MKVCYTDSMYTIQIPRNVPDPGLYYMDYEDLSALDDLLADPAPSLLQNDTEYETYRLIQDATRDIIIPVSTIKGSWFVPLSWLVKV